MSLLRSFPKLSFTLVLLSIVGIAISQRSIGLLLVAGALAAISWYLTEGPRGRWLPRWVSNVLVVGVSLNIIVDVMQNPDDVLGVLGRFILWLMIIKLYERRTSRDHGHLLGLSLLLMITGCLHTVDLFFGIILFVYALLGLYVLVLFQLHAAHEKSRDERFAAMPEHSTAAPLIKPITGRYVGAQLRSLTVVVAVCGFALGMVIFMVFPRGLGEGVVEMLSSPSQDRRPGYSDEVDLISGGRITDSRRGVMSVQLQDQEGRPFVSGEPLLLRGAVLDRYDGRGRWRSASRTEDTLSVEAGRFTSLLSDNRGDAFEDELLDDSRIVTVHVEMLQNLDTVMTLYPPVAVAMDASQDLLVDQLRLTMQQQRSAPRLHRYRVKTVPLASDELLQRLDAGGQSRIRLSPRLRNSEVQALAQQLLRDGGLPVDPPGEHGSAERFEWSHAAAHQFMRYLHSPEFMYTLDLSGMVLPHEGGRQMDPVSYFLLEYQRGHCEYFASAMVSLCLHVGIEARLVTGFVAYEYDGATQRYTIVESNAHAWTEVRTEKHRWTVFDPTPPATLRELHAGGSVADRLRWFYDSFDGMWGRTIVDFDRTRQAQLADSGANATIGQQANEFVRALRNWMERVNRAFYLGPAGYFYMAFIGGILVLAIIALIKLMRRSLLLKRLFNLRHVRGRDQRRMLKQLGFYADMLVTLRRAGLAKPHWQPPLLYAKAVQLQSPEAATIIEKLTAAFYSIRYGGAELSPKELAQKQRQVTELEAVLRSRPVHL